MAPIKLEELALVFGLVLIGFSAMSGVFMLLSGIVLVVWALLKIF